jgi:23S rRNA (uracil1939-C5)-methyltransferase
MTLIKNKTYICKVLRIGYSGEGIAKIKNVIVFIEKVLPEEKVKIKIIKISKNYAVGKLIKIIKPCKHRISDICNNKQCGGCSFTFVEYKYQLTLKSQILKSFFKQNFSFIPDINNFITSDNIFNYRNKVILPIRKNKNNKTVVGFFANRSHRIVDITNCKIQPGITEKIINFISHYIDKNNIPVYNENNHKGYFRNLILKQSNIDNKLMLIFVINSADISFAKKLSDILKQTIPDINSVYVCINQTKSNFVLNGKIKHLSGNKFIVSKLKNYNFLMGPETFFQTNYNATQKMYEYIFNKISKNNILFDIYSGISSIGIYMNKLFKQIYCIESNIKSSVLADKNIKLNNILKIKNINGDAFIQTKFLLRKNIIPDYIILDPPRKGCEKKLIDLIIKYNIKNIVYISCNPATLTRDLNFFYNNGYKIISVQPFDMFPHTFHIETAVFLQKNN